MIPTQWYAASIAAIASIARLQGSMVWSYIFLNGFCMGLSIKNHSDLIIRLGTMTSINVIPLFLGSRTSLVADFLGFSLHTYYLTHHWIGRVVIIQNLLHVGLGYVCVTPWTFDSSPISRISVSRFLPKCDDANCKKVDFSASTITSIVSLLNTDFNIRGFFLLPFDSSISRCGYQQSCG